MLFCLPISDSKENVAKENALKTEVDMYQKERWLLHVDFIETTNPATFLKPRITLFLQRGRTIEVVHVCIHKLFNPTNLNCCVIKQNVTLLSWVWPKRSIPSTARLDFQEVYVLNVFVQPCVCVCVCVYIYIYILQQCDGCLVDETNFAKFDGKF